MNYTKSFDEMFAESNKAQFDMEEAGRRLIAKIKEINEALKLKQQDQLTEEQLIEREKVSSEPVTKDSTIL